MSAELVERALSCSRADGCIVLVEHSSALQLRWAGNTLTTNGSTRDRCVTVVSVVGESVGVRSSSVVDDLPGLVRASEHAAREAGPAEDAGPLVTGDAAPDFAEEAEDAGSGIFDRLAVELGEAFGAARAADRRLYGYASHDVTTTWLGSSTGLRLRHAQPTGYIELTGKQDRPGASTWVGQHTRDWSDVLVPRLDEQVQRRLGWARRRVDLPAGRYETVLPPSAVADLMIYAYWSAAGREARQGRSAFARAAGASRVGDRLGPPGLRLGSDPRAAGLGTAPFAVTRGSSSVSSVFDNGLPLPATDWVADGRLSALLESRATAGAAGVPVTPYVPNLVLEQRGATATTDDLVSSTRRGLLLTCLWYIREVDPQVLLLTGLTRDGVYLVEDGEVTGVVNNFRFNESPVDLLGRLGEVGASEPTLPREWSDDFTWVRMPPVRVPDFHMSSVSQAS